MCEAEQITLKLNELNILHTGQCMFNFDNMVHMDHVNGVFILNMNDIISLNWIYDSLIKPNISELQFYNPLNKLNVPALCAKLSKLQQNYIPVICYLDVSEQVNNILLKPKKGILPQNIANIKARLNTLVNIINANLLLNGSNNSKDNIYSYFITYQKDGFDLRWYGTKIFINSFIMSTIKYINRDFYACQYLAGITYSHNFKAIIQNRNTNLIACLANGYRFIDIIEFIANTADVPSLYANKYLAENEQYLKNIYETKKQYIDCLKDNQQNIKKQLEKIINSDTPINIIGMNLDTIFDNHIMEGIKETIAGLTHPASASASASASTILHGGNSEIKKSTDSCSLTSTDFGNEFKIISFIDMLKPESFLSGLTSASKTFTLGSENKDNRPKVAHYMPFVSDEPEVMATYIKNMIIEPGKTNIIIIYGLTVTLETIKTIVAGLCNRLDDGTKITSKYINFDINPYIRCLLGYSSYFIKFYAESKGLDIKKSCKMEDMILTKRLRLWARFYNYIGTVRHIEPIKHGIVVNSANNTNCPENTPHECCKCCKCLSLSGTEYYEIKYLPYLTNATLNYIEINNDIWIPRV